MVKDSILNDIEKSKTNFDKFIYNFKIKNMKNYIWIKIIIIPLN